MAYPYKKMTEEDFARIRSFTADDRVWTARRSPRNIITMRCGVRKLSPGALRGSHQQRRSLRHYGIRLQRNIPVVCRGAGTGLAGGATCKYGGIMLSVMRMNKIFPVDHKNQTITAEPGALLVDVPGGGPPRRDCSIPRIPGRRPPPSAATSSPTREA